MSKGMVYHYSHMCASGTPCLCPRAYKACMGRISCQCGTESKGFPKMGRTEEETHTAWEQNRAGLAPQSRQIAFAGNPPHNIN